MTNTKYDHVRGGGDPTVPIEPDDPASLAGMITDSVNVDVDGIPDIPTPPTATGISLADVDARHTSHLMAAPNVRQLPDPAPPEYLAWLEADRRLLDARDAAHDGAGDVRAAEARDRQNALNAARTGSAMPKPTAPAAAAAAVEAIRRFDAEISLAGEALGQVAPALRKAWPAWRRQLIDTVNVTTERGETALARLEATLIDRSAAVMQLLTVDRLYGEGKPGEIIEHSPPPGVHPSTWQQPRSQGVSVRDLLNNGPSLSANHAARQVPDLRSVRVMLAASTLNEEWSPTDDDGPDDPDDDDTLPPAA